MKRAKMSNPYQSFDCMRGFRNSAGPEPMHPDDYSAHRAWVIARRSRECGAGNFS